MQTTTIFTITCRRCSQRVVRDAFGWQHQAEYVYHRPLLPLSVLRSAS
jgi:hypothetical protein